MPDSCLKLFRFAAGHVNTKDVSDFAPADPGYADYVRHFNTILESHALPDKVIFETTETIALTRWTDASAYPDPIRFRRFRTFTNSVGLALLATGTPRALDINPNYTAVSLLEDAEILGDQDLLSLLSPAFAETYEALNTTNPHDGDTAFLSLAQILLVYMGRRPKEDLPALANRLMAEESACVSRESNDFLWGCTVYDQLHDRWKELVRKYMPPNQSNRDLALLRDALLAQ